MVCLKNRGRVENGFDWPMGRGKQTFRLLEKKYTGAPSSDLIKYMYTLLLGVYCISI